jgi:hypothetical protein
MAWLEDIISLLVTGGVGVSNTSIFLTSQGSIPLGPGPYLLITETAGFAPERLHTDSDGRLNAAAYERPGAQLLARGANFIDVRAMSRAAWTVLDGRYNETINGTWYREITALQRPFDIGPDDAKRVRVVFNILGVKALS